MGCARENTWCTIHCFKPKLFKRKLMNGFTDGVKVEQGLSHQHRSIAGLYLHSRGMSHQCWETRSRWRRVRSSIAPSWCMRIHKEYHGRRASIQSLACACGVGAHPITLSVGLAKADAHTSLWSSTSMTKPRCAGRLNSKPAYCQNTHTKRQW